MAALTLALTPAAAAAEDATPQPTNAQIIEAAAQSPWPRFSACVSWRESHDNYRARNPEAGSSAQGRWQFINAQWQHSLPWMIRDRLIEHGLNRATAQQWRERLDALEIARWPGLMQDIGHAAVLAAGIRGDGQGWLHWKGGNGCNALIGR